MYIGNSPAIDTWISYIHMLTKSKGLHGNTRLSINIKKQLIIESYVYTHAVMRSSTAEASIVNS